MYCYVINFWDEIDNTDCTEKGIVGASSYGEAAQKITDYYGAKNVIEIKLYESEDVLCQDELLDMFNS